MRHWNRTIALALCITPFGLGPARATAQQPRGAGGESDFYPGPQSIREFYLQLPTPLPADLPEKRIQVRVHDMGDKKLLLPIYIMKDATVTTEPGVGATITVAILDAINSPETEEAIHNAMDKQLGKEKWNTVIPIGNSVELTLWINSNGEEAPLATGRFSRAAGQHLAKLSFKIDGTASAVLKDAHVSQLGLTFSETYRGRFRKDSLDATLSVASNNAVTFENQLSSAPDGKPATLLVAIGGGVDQLVAVQNFFSRRVALQVFTREGAPVNQSLLQYVIDKLFAGLYTENFNLGERQQDEVVTFLFANGLRATAAMGTFRKIKDQLKSEANRLKETANTLQTKDQTENEIDVSGKFSYLGIGGEGANSVRWKKLNERSSSDRLKLQSHDFLNMAKYIEGELPVAVMNAKQLQKLSARAIDTLAVSVGTFTDGRATLTYTLSFQGYALWAENRRVTESRELIEKQSAEAARDAATSRLAAARAEKAKFMANAGSLIGTMKNTGVQSRKPRQEQFYVSGLRGAWQHLSTIGKWGPGEGDIFFAEWAAQKDAPNPLTRKELFDRATALTAALDTAFESASRDIMDVLVSVASQEAIIVEAEGEIRKQTETIDKLAKSICSPNKN